MDDVRYPDQKTPQASQDAPPTRGKAKAFLGLALVLGLIGGAGAWYWLSVRGTESTDDAAIDGHVSQVAPQIGGRVVALLVDDNQLVKAGDALVNIDPRDYQVRLDQALAQRAQAAAELAQAKATLGVRRADVGQAEANIRVTQSDQLQAQQDYTRYRSINQRAITRQQLDNAAAALRGAQAGWRRTSTPRTACAPNWRSPRPSWPRPRRRCTPMTPTWKTPACSCPTPMW
jgi:membrane fusion protein (multidrug efflux system)